MASPDLSWCHLSLLFLVALENAAKGENSHHLVEAMYLTVQRVWIMMAEAGGPGTG